MMSEREREARTAFCVTVAALNLAVPSGEASQQYDDLQRCFCAEWLCKTIYWGDIDSQSSVTDLLGRGFAVDVTFRSTEAQCWWTALQYRCQVVFKDMNKYIIKELWSGVFYPGLWYEAVHWLWSSCMRRSFLQGTQCRRGPRISSSCWASLAEDEFARVETRDGQKISSLKKKNCSKSNCWVNDVKVFQVFTVQPQNTIRILHTLNRKGN